LTKLLVVGGRTSNGYTNEVEIIDLETSSTTCANAAKYPTAIESPVGCLKERSHPLICGGHPYNKDCFLLNDNGEWETFGLMNEVRRYAAISASPYPTEESSFFVTGGLNELNNVTQSAELLKGNTWNVKPDMPDALHFHCMALLNSTTLIATGGRNALFRPGESATYLFNTMTEKWTEGPSLNSKRAGHTCGRIKKNKESNDFSVIVVGGYDGKYISSVEIFDEIDGNWNYGPNLPIEGCCGVLIEDPTGGVVQIGNQLYDDEGRLIYSDAIYRLPHAGPDAKWIKMPQKLSTGKSCQAAFLVQDDIAKCQPSLV
jgi:hypothetical protein